VYDKSGIVEFAQALHELGWDLISSGGTARVIAAAGVPVTDVADLTGVPAILGHRVVTLHPKVHGGLLADPTNAEHRSDMAEYGIEPIELVVANLYPFSAEPSIELIDIGGPTMVRAAAKNHAFVGIVTDPSRYDEVLTELRAEGALTQATRTRLARDAFAHTAAYDAEILAWFDAGQPASGATAGDAAASDNADAPAELPATISLTLTREQVLRYGENPHQVGARYSAAGESGWWATAQQHGGKEMSYLNVYDTEAAWRLVHSIGERPAAVVIKHANPCGVAVADDDDYQHEDVIR
jgi:phosphoribosylaminoimidazolecarboxamide formyltransferase/IMP cyclohydrolase